MAKKKFDASAMQKWLVAHCEKLVFGLVMVVFLLFVVSAVRRETLDSAKQPDKLRDLAQELENHVANSPFRAEEVGVKVAHYGNRIKHEVVPAEGYILGTPYNPPLEELKNRRTTPKLLVAEQVRAVGAFGAFAYKRPPENQRIDLQSLPADQQQRAMEQIKQQEARMKERRLVPAGGKNAFRPPKDSIVKPQPCVIITALIPTRAQEDEYNRVFRSAMNYNNNRDKPHYAGWVLERAEVTSDDMSNLRWVVIPHSDELYQSFEAEFKDDRFPPEAYHDNILTMNLPPLIGDHWDEVVMHPAILKDIEKKKVEAAARQAAENAANAAKLEAQNRQNQGRQQRGGFGLEPAEKPEVVVKPEPAAPLPKISPLTHKMMRVFDFNVESNKKYRYRIKLGLNNPNHNVRSQFLENPEDSKEQYLAAEFSEPSPVVGVPDAQRVFAGTVKSTPPHSTAELDVEVLVDSFDMVTGLEVGVPTKVVKGQVANVVLGRPARVRDRDGNLTTADKIDFRSGTLVVDIRGGHKFESKYGWKNDKTLSVPGEVLLLDPQGNLKVRNEWDDWDLFANRQEPPEAAPQSNALGRGGPQPPGPPGRGGVQNPQQQPGRGGPNPQQPGRGGAMQTGPAGGRGGPAQPGQGGGRGGGGGGGGGRGGRGQ